MSGPDGEPSSVFEGPELERAESAWQGNIGAALLLDGEWSGDLTVSLALPLQQYRGGRAWRAVRRLEVLIQALTAYPWWRTGELIRDGEQPVVVTIVDEGGVEFQTSSFAVLSLDRLVGTGPAPLGVGAKRVSVEASSAAQVPDGLALPEELIPNGGCVGADALADILLARAEACAWAWLSNRTSIDKLGNFASLEYSGYRPRVFRLGADGFTGEAGQRSTQLYAWATNESSPDRILAIRQVLSLYESDTLPTRPEDVARAAEPLYQALRAGEVAVVLESQRQTRAMAIETALKSTDAARSAAKSATERTIASLAGVAAIAVAHATAVLDQSDARDISFIIAGLFVFLGLWTIFIEGPAMQAPLDAFRGDLKLLGYLLSEADRTSILGMEARRLAERDVCRVRIATPLVYLLGATVTLAVAHYRFGLWR
jgi:hypothetical protein